MMKKYKILGKGQIILLIFSTLIFTKSFVDGFNVGIRSTSCSLDPSEGNNACKSLYEAECDGAHCKCPAGTHEEKTLNKCVPGAASKPKGDDEFGDLPFDYVPGKKPEPKPKPKPAQPHPPAQHKIPAQPQAPVEDPHMAEKTGGGIGGGVGLLILIGVVYFCCCRGEKGKNMRSKLPFFKGSGGGGGQPGANYQMQQQQPEMYPNAPPPAGGPYPQYPQSPPMQQPYYPQPNAPPAAPPPY